MKHAGVRRRKDFEHRASPAIERLHRDMADYRPSKEGLPL